MQFISWQFIVFFVVVMITLFSGIKGKKYILALFNILFYISSGITGFLSMLAFTLMTYFFGRIIEKHKGKILFAFIIALSLLPLLVFKYTNFVISDILKMDSINIIAPLGISFFSFQGIGYLIDVYKGKCASEKNIINYFVFISLFTCVTSGPINRSQSILKQIREYNKKAFEYDRCAEGFRFILVGLFLKILVSSRMEQLVSVPFSAPSKSSGLALLIASICFTIQIFCDFCGYSYMSYGLSKVIGIDVIQNFNAPYASKSVTEFWRRWHISLSSWFKDYVYIPLGGNRCSKFKSYLNLLITFTISGLWHGASWTFIVWGMLNGLCLIIERMTNFNKNISGKIRVFFHWLITFIVTNTMWIFFRASTLKDAFLIIRKIALESVFNISSIMTVAGLEELFSELGTTLSIMIAATIVLFMFVIFEWCADRKENPIGFLCNKNPILRWMIYIGVAVIILTLGITGEAGEFIYAKF